MRIVNLDQMVVSCITKTLVDAGVSAEEAATRASAALEEARVVVQDKVDETLPSLLDTGLYEGHAYNEAFRIGCVELMTWAAANA